MRAVISILVLASVALAVAGQTTVAPGIAQDSNCEKVWSGDMPERFSKSTLTALRKPVGYDEWHPDYKNLATYAHFNCILAASVRKYGANVDLEALSKNTLDIAKRRMFDGNWRRRGITLNQVEQFGQGLIEGFSEDAGGLASALGGSVTECIKDLGDIASDIYGYFETKSSDIVDDIRDVAKAIIQCIDAASDFTPVGWVKDLLDVAKVVFDATTIYQKCSPLIGDVEASTFDAHQTGKDTGICLHQLVAEFSRRREAPPADWSCHANHYADGLQCHLRCGTLDPDCLDGRLPVAFQPEHHAKAAHAEWDCPAQFYNGNDGCDVGCNAVDPDCSSSTATRFTWSEKSFTTAADKARKATIAQNSVRASTSTPKSNPSTGGSNSGSLSGPAIAGIVVAVCVVVAMVGMLVVTRRKQTHTVLNTELGESLMASQSDL